MEKQAREWNLEECWAGREESLPPWQPGCLFSLHCAQACSLLPRLCSPPALSLPSINDPTPFTEDYTRECHRQPCSVEAGITEETSSNSLTWLLSSFQVGGNSSDLACPSLKWQSTDLHHRQEAESRYVTCQYGREGLFHLALLCYVGVLRWDFHIHPRLPLNPGQVSDST